MSNGDNLKELYDKYSGAMAYIVVKTSDGSESIGSAFHIGGGIFVTARHVVEDNVIVSVATTERWYEEDPNGLDMIAGKPGRFTLHSALEGTVISGPHFHPDPSIDVAALVVDGLEAATIPLGGHYDDWINDSQFVLKSALIMGYPPIPTSDRPVLVAARAEVNAVVDPYIGKHPRFIVSAIPRGGFSGGVCVIEWDFVLGVVIHSLVRDTQETESGFMSVLTVEPIWDCLRHHNLVPPGQEFDPNFETAPSTP